MYIMVLLKYILGYVNVKIEGFFVERVMNKAINKKIFLWNIKRDKSTIMYANVGVENFRELVKISKENKCKIEILEKKGLPFLLNKYRKRKVFAVLIIIVLGMLLTLSNFVWNIQIEGTDKINNQELLEELQEQGLKTGSFKHSINKDAIINKIRLDRKDVAWIGIEIEGTNAIVKVVEAEEKPEIVDKEDYCNIVANKYAQIVKVSAQNGTALVKEGDIVTQGQILVAGWMEGKYTGTRYVHAAGEVQAKVWYTEKEKIELNQVVEEKTGKIENKYQIKFNNFTINLYKTLSKFENYDTIDTNNKIRIFSNFYLPIELIKRTNYEKIENEITYGTEEATEIETKKLSEKLESNIANKENILQKYVNTYAGEGFIEVEVIYEVLENIATKEKIVF